MALLNKGARPVPSGPRLQDLTPCVRRMPGLPPTLLGPQNHDGAARLERSRLIPNKPMRHDLSNEPVRFCL